MGLWKSYFKYKVTMYTLTLRGESSGPLMFLSCWWGFWPTWAKKSESIVIISVSSLAASKCDSLYFRIDKPTWNKTYKITVLLIQIMNDSPIKIHVWTIPFKLETVSIKLWATIHSNYEPLSIQILPLIHQWRNSQWY